MPKFVIEREMPGVGSLPSEQLQQAARESNEVVRELGPDIQWVNSYVTADKIFCIYIAPDPDILHEHARCLDIPATRISPVVVEQDPTVGE